MKQCYTNATVMWNERDIVRRESLIKEIPLLIYQTWNTLNRAVRIERCETPILTPECRLTSHIVSGFELLQTSRGFLRPETTAGTYEAMSQRFALDSLQKELPFCMWQVGISFRDEKNPDTMRASKLRLVQFYQMEFQLFTSHSTKANYLLPALTSLTNRFGGIITVPNSLPHYSLETYDWTIDGLEIAGCSIRNDWPHGKVYEVAIGLDRLLALTL